MGTGARRQVTIVELSVYDHTVPLVAGYLQAYATQDRLIDDAFTFDIFTRGLTGDVGEWGAELCSRDSAVYAFSCYLWNTGAVRILLDEILTHRPDAYVMLGGPQVMNHAADYLPVGAHRALVCNGEGEQPFYEFLREIATGNPQFERVSGVTFWSDGELLSTSAAPRLAQLDSLPSPFTTGVFDGREYTFAVIETNRGCPFDCGFCFWGAATNAKVYRFDEKRVRGDLDWIARNCVPSVFIADANWGIAPRDVDLSRHIVECRQRHGFPISVVTTAAKNRPDRVADIIEILVAGGLVTSQPISLQTLTPDALRLVRRENIGSDSYDSLQQRLNDRNISSFVELIWPLPGDTLDGFRLGLAQLCRRGADTLTVYPQLLLHNTDLYDRRLSLGIEVERAPDPYAEADVVVATAGVDRDECVAGTWLSLAVHLVHNARGGYYLGRYLDRNGTPYEQFFTEVADFLRAACDPITTFLAGSVADRDNYRLNSVGALTHLVLHQWRAQFDRLLTAFAQRQPWYADPSARCALDLDLVARPYVYAEQVRLPGVPPAEVGWESTGHHEIRVSVPAEHAALPAELGMVPAGPVRSLRLEHPVAGKSAVAHGGDPLGNAGYCQLMIQRVRAILPRCTALTTVPDDRAGA